MPDLHVSVVSCAFRPGGIDVLLAGMRDQTYPKAHWEIILIDRRYERRHAEVMDLARRYEVPLIHAPEHRRNGRWGCTASAYNTGLALARGEIIILLTDWTYAPPGWIEAHLQHHIGGRPTYVIAPYRYHAVGITKAMYDELAPEFIRWSHLVYPWEAFLHQPKLRTKNADIIPPQEVRAESECLTEDAVLRGEVFDESFIFEDGLFQPEWLDRMPPFPGDDPGLRRHFPLQAVEPPMAHLKNESMPRAPVYAINGVDVWGERGGRMQIDTDFGLRMARIGCRLLWEPAALAHCVNPRHGVCRTMPFGSAPHRVAGRWNQEDCDRFQWRRERDVRLGQFIPAPAPYTMEDLARRLEWWRAADTIPTDGLDVPDREFFGRDIWPDSPYTETP